MPKVELMKRVKLTFQAGSEAGAADLSLPRADFTFIFGIGSGGLTPFESLLDQHTEIEKIAFRLAGSEAGLFFGHLAPPLGQLFEDHDEVYFNVSIVGIETPQPREVIRAMAEITAHGHGAGCDCGCGCG
jgi:hypothetical protein